MTKRSFLPWETNHLRRFGLNPETIDVSNTTPVEYLTGHAEFCGHDLLVTPSVLIPRLETEAIVDIVLRNIASLPSSTFQLADVGCGSGALGIAIAFKLGKLKLPFHLYLSDVSPLALTLTETNCHRLIPSLSDSLTVLRSDLLDSYPDSPKLNCLVSNLPYIPTSRLADLDPSVRDHEPPTALDGGPDGTLLINRLLNRLPSYLTSPSLAIFEVDHLHQLSDFQIPPGFHAEIDKDIYGKNRYLILNHQNL